MLFLFVLFLLCLIFPDITQTGIKNGLILLVNQVIPALYPFIVLSSAMKYMQSEKSDKIRIFLAFLSGYPLGAKIISSDPVRIWILSLQDMLLLCNNPSPAFMISYVGHVCLEHPGMGILIYLVVLSSNFITVLLNVLFRRFLGKQIQKDTYIQACSVSDSFLDTIVNDSFHSLLNIAAYIMMFSVCVSFINTIPFVSENLKSVCIGIIEMTTGIGKISKLPWNMEKKLILITGCVSYGGLSIMAQTYNMIEKSSLSIKKYMTDKAISACIAMSVMYIIIHVFNY